MKAQHGVDQDRRDQRDGQRDQQDVARIDQHCVTQAGLADDDLEHIGARRRPSAHHDEAVAIAEQRSEGRPDAVQRPQRGQVVLGENLRRHVSLGNQPALALAAAGNGFDADGSQQSVLQVGRQRRLRRGAGQRHHGGRIESLLQPYIAEVGDRGDVDHTSANMTTGPSM
jgi:hypothetical protein